MAVDLTLQIPKDYTIDSRIGSKYDHLAWPGPTPLPFAAELGMNILVNLLLKDGADVGLKGRDGRAPISLASEK